MQAPSDYLQTNNKKWLCYGEAHNVSPETLLVKRKITKGQSMNASYNRWIMSSNLEMRKKRMIDRSQPISRVEILSQFLKT